MPESLLDTRTFVESVFADEINQDPDLLDEYRIAQEQAFSLLADR